jgi:hypothetical protein
MNDALTEDMVLDMLRDWKPNSEDERLKLTSGAAPHEVCGVLRMHRAGMDGDSIRKILHTPATKLIKVFERAFDDERDAHTRGLPIHDDAI